MLWLSYSLTHITIRNLKNLFIVFSILFILCNDFFDKRKICKFWNNSNDTTQLFKVPETLAWQISCTGSSGGKSISLDQENNIIVSGNFEDSIFFEKNILIAKDLFDGFVVKYDHLGNLIWVQQIGGLNVEFVSSMSIDKSGSIYVGGMFRDEIQFGDTLIKSQKQSAFLVKFSKDGEVIWARSMGDGEVNWGKSVEVDQSNDVYFTGFFGNEFSSVDSIPSFSRNSHAFLTKCDKNGNELWTRQFRGGSSYGESVTSDQEGGIYLAGVFFDTLYYDNEFLVARSKKLDNSVIGYSEGFIARYNGMGQRLWLLRMGGEGPDVFGSIISNTSGQLFVGGFFTNINASFDTIPLVSRDQADYVTVNMDQFVSKLKSDGTVSWFFNKVPSEYGNDRNLTIDGSGNLFIGGNISYTKRIADRILKANGKADIVVTKLSADGKIVWMKQDGGTGQENIGGITVSSGGNIYVTGSFQGTTILGGQTFTARGKTDVFVVRYRDI